MRISDWSSDVCSSDLHKWGQQETPRRLWVRCQISTRQAKRTPKPRSEEHTSELQSLMRRSYAVFCLKKKQQYSAQLNQRKHTTMHMHNLRSIRRNNHITQLTQHLLCNKQLFTSNNRSLNR